MRKLLEFYHNQQKYYLKKAEESRAKADEALTTEAKEGWLSAARSWDKMAERMGVRIRELKLKLR